MSRHRKRVPITQSKAFVTALSLGAAALSTVILLQSMAPREAIAMDSQQNLPEEDESDAGQVFTDTVTPEESESSSPSFSIDDELARQERLQSSSGVSYSYQTLSAVALETSSSNGFKVRDPNAPEEEEASEEQPEPAAESETAETTETAEPVIYTSSSTGAANIPAWKQQNSDVVGWLKIPGTNINYPVVQGPTNNYYLELGYDKNYSFNGVIWADYDVKSGTRSEISDNTVLYGHNWTNYSATPRIGNANDVMFAQLTGYHYLSFAQQHPYIYYSTEDEEMVWQVFACFYTEDSFYYIDCNPTQEWFSQIISEAKDRSLHNFDTSVTTSDKILTLSTCTRAYGQREDQRFVVMARLMDKGAAQVPITVTANTDFKPPQF